MGNIGWSGIIIVAVLVILLFGRGKISSIMGDVAKGIKSFKKGMKEPTESVTQDEANQDKTSEDSKKDSK